MLSKKRKIKDNPGQTMVEFALALPVVLMLVFGIIEFGFLLWSYSSVNSAAREAARYGIAIGDGTVSGQRYYDCEGIKNAAMKAGGFAGMDTSDIFIHYDNGLLPDENAASPNPNYARKYNSCEDLVLDAADGDDDIIFGDRIVISVSHDYQPIAALIGFNIQPFNMVAISNRTIVKDATVSSGDDGSGGGGGGGETPACFVLSTVADLEEGGSAPTINPNMSPSGDCDAEGWGFFLGGDDVGLTASPNSGWSVAGWSGTDNDGSLSTTNSVNMPGANHTITVYYVNNNPTCYTLNTSTTGDGSGTLTAIPVNSTGCDPNKYLPGTSIELEAIPNVGSEFDGWSGTDDDSITSGTNYVTMPAVEGYSVSVEFDLSTTTCYALSVGHTGTGTDPVPTGSNCAGGLYAENTVVGLNATAGAGFEVGSWTGTDNDASTSTTNTVTMDGDKAVVVNYIQSYTPDPPLNVRIPNNLAAGEWKWNSGLKACQKIDLRWDSNSSWSPNSPVNYNVFNGSTSYGTINGYFWDANFSIGSGETITLGVQAVFTGGVTSSISEVNYICFDEVLDYVGTTIK